MAGAFLAALGGAIGGAVLGFFGAFYLQRRRDRDEARAQILSIVLEMSLLEDTLTQAIERHHRLREEMRRDTWDRYNMTLVNWLPWHLVTALHRHNLQFDTVRSAYRTLSTSLTEGAELDDMLSSLWCFFYWSRFLREMIQASVRRFERGFFPKMPSDARPSKREEEKLVRLIQRLEQEALAFIRSKGIEPKTFIPVSVTSIRE